MQIGIGIITGYSILQGDTGLFINSFLPLLISLTPEYLSRRYDYELNVVAGVWIAAAAFIHAFGATGPYEQFGWYDSVAHAVSGSLMAGVGYSIVDALDRASDEVEFHSGFKLLFMFLFTLGIGAYWEIIEFSLGKLSEVIGGEPALAQYGTEDIVKDILYDGLGGILVGVAGTQFFEGLSDFFTKSDKTQEKLK
jgi:uncharacterized membrane protein YjdF